MTTPYGHTIRTLRCLTHKQLLELFHDIGKISVINTIADAAVEFSDNYEELEEEKSENELGECEEYLEVDNLRRAREGL